MRILILAYFTVVGLIANGQVITDQKWTPDKVRILLQVSTVNKNFPKAYLKHHTDTSLVLSINSVFYGAPFTESDEVLGYKEIETVSFKRKGSGVKMGIAGIGIGVVIGVFTGLFMGDDPPLTHNGATAKEKAIKMGTLSGVFGGAIGFAFGALRRKRFTVDGLLYKFKDFSNYAQFQTNRNKLVTY